MKKYVLEHKYEIPTAYFKCLADYPFENGTCWCVKDIKSAKKFDTVEDAKHVKNQINDNDDYIIRGIIVID